jgi:site-specific DNA recombinase
VYEWYLNEEWESVSVRNIVKKMQESVPPPRKSKQWHDGFITNMLKRKQYTGMSYYNRTKNDYNEVGELRENGHGKRKHPIPRPRNEEEWIKQSIPTIIDEERWEAVQEKMKKNRQFSMRNNQKHFYMLRGLLVCGECGYTMSGRSTKPGKITYYCYYGGVNSSPDVKKHSCKITGEVIETIVWEEISKLLKNPELISQAWQMMSTNENRGKEQGEIERLESRVKKIARQQDRLLDLYQEEQIEKETYLERKQRLHQEEQNITDQLQAYIQEERGEEVKQNIIGEFEQFSQSVSEKLINPTPQLKREVIRLLIDHIVVNENEIVIKHIVPAIKDCRLTHPHRNTEIQKSGGKNIFSYFCASVRFL